MGGLFGKKGQAQVDQRLNAIQINQSAYGNPVPLVYGKTRVPSNLGWYGSFVATPHTQRLGGGKGGGGGNSTTSFTYSAALILMLCEGPITGIGTVWADKAQKALSDLGLTLFTGAGGQAAWSYLSTNFPSQAVPYDHTAYVANASFDLGGSAALPNLTFEVKALKPYNAGTIDDAEITDIIVDYLGDANHGAQFSYLGTIQGAGATTLQTYCIANGFFISPAETTQRSAVEFLRELLTIANAEANWSAGVLNIVPYGNESVTGNSKTYTPVLTPQFTFTDDDYCPDEGADPVVTTRKAAAQTFNRVRVEYLDRANQYNVAIAEATDANDIALNGERAMPTVTLHSITTVGVARTVAQLILQRQLYVRNTFEFRVRADYSLLEPMDLAAINDSSQGIVNQLVRILETTDDEEDGFSIVAEEVPVGPAAAPVYNWQAAQGYAANYFASPGSISTPLFFSIPALLVAIDGGFQLGIAVSGAGGVWGGCDVYMSLDNTTYKYVGAISGPARYGTLRSTFASHADPDDTNTLQLQLVNTTLALTSGTTADEDNLVTLMYVDGEFMSYRTATLVGTGQYDLTHIRRGKYGSSAASHASGNKWARVDDAIFRMPYDRSMLGKTVYFKFPSFNIYGQANETLAGVGAYSYALSNQGAATLIGADDPIMRWRVDGGNVAPTYITDGVDGPYVMRATNYSTYRSDRRPFDRNKTYRLSTWARSSSATGIVYFLVAFYDATGALITPGAAPWFTGTYNYWRIAGQTVPTTFTKYQVTFGPLGELDIPAGAVSYEIGALLNYTTGTDTIDIQSMMCDVDTSNTLDFSPIMTAHTMSLLTDTRSFLGNAAGVSAWASQVYSAERYGACAVSWQPTLTTQFLMVGLNTDPTLDANYTSIDYSIYCTGTGTLYAYESGVASPQIGTYVAGDHLSVEYDGQTVRYKQNGNTLRAVPNVVGQRFYLDSSFNPGAQIDNLSFAKIESQNVVAGDGWVADANGKPAGFRGVENATDQTHISFSAAGRVAIDGTSAWAFGLPAIPVEAGQPYTLFVKHRSTGASATGLYIRCNEKSSALAAGKSHIGNAPFETVCDTRTSLVDMVAFGPMPGTAVIESVYTYTPTAGAKFASLSFYNYGTTGVSYEIESVRMVRQGTLDDVLVRGGSMVDLNTQILGQLATAFAAAGLINTNISVNANGSLTGAGGGAPVISSLTGSVATGQLTTNVLAAMQAVIGNLAAIKADLGAITAGTIDLSSGTSYIKSGQSAYNTGVGFWIERNGGTPRLSIGNPSGNYITWDGTTLKVRGALDFTSSSFTPNWSAGFGGSPPVGNFNYIDFGSFVALWWSPTGTLGTSNATDMSIDNLPAGIRPASAIQVAAVNINNGGYEPGFAIVRPTGVVDFAVFILSGSHMVGGNNFTASGSKGPSPGNIYVYSKV